MIAVYESEEQAEAAGLLEALFERAEKVAKDRLSGYAEGQAALLTEARARDLLGSLNEWRMAVAGANPSWGFLRQMVLLAETFPPRRTDSRQQRVVAKKPRTQKGTREIREAVSKHPDRSAKEIGRIIETTNGLNLTESQIRGKVHRARKKKK